MAGFFFPPHPSVHFKIPPDQLPNLEKQSGWLAQRKYNGWHSVIHVNRDKNICNLWNRRGKPFEKYQLTPEMRECFFRQFSGDVVLDGELLHGQAISQITGQQALRHTIVLFDILYLNKNLLTEDFGERIFLLSSICGDPKSLEIKKRGLVVQEVGESRLWLAQLFQDEFLYRFYEMYDFDSSGLDKYPDIEGLVCKRVKNSRLGLGNIQYDVNWMMRVRKTKEKTYQF